MAFIFALTLEREIVEGKLSLIFAWNPTTEIQRFCWHLWILPARGGARQPPVLHPWQGRNAQPRAHTAAFQPLHGFAPPRDTSAPQNNSPCTYSALSWRRWVRQEHDKASHFMWNDVISGGLSMCSRAQLRAGCWEQQRNESQTSSQLQPARDGKTPDSN